MPQRIEGQIAIDDAAEETSIVFKRVDSNKEIE